MASTPGTGPDGTGGADEGRQPDESHFSDALFNQPDRSSQPDQTDLPDQVAGQTCAFCGCRQVVWVHPLATDRVLFRRFGKDEVASSIWGLCEPCEQLYQSGRDDELIALMKSAGGWVWQGTEVDDVLRKPVDVFREADLGRRPISG